MNAMKRFLILAACSGALAFAADLAQAHTVYVLSMSRGLDQYLANRLTNGHVFQVVTDPKLADVIFTDRIGDAFLAQLQNISPSPADVKETAKPPAKDAKDGSKDTQSSNSMFAPPVNKLENPALLSTFGRNKGTIFLVDAKSREVVWSVYEPPKGFDSKEMDRTASDIVSRLKKDIQKK